MLLLSDFYAFYGLFACPACASSYLIDSDFLFLDLLAGFSPRRATHFLCFAKESKQRKATLLSATPALRYGAPCGAQSSRGLVQTRLRLRQARALVRLALRSSAQTEGVRNECGSGLLFSCSFPRWGKVGMGASGGQTPAGQQTSKRFAPWRLQALFQFAEPPSQPSPRGGRSQYPLSGAHGSLPAFLPSCLPPPPRPGWACAAPQKRDQGRALFEPGLSLRGPPLLRRSAGTQTAGRLFFGNFLLAKQKKVSSRRATPGQQPLAKLTRNRKAAELMAGARP